jgi:hypothetical protein
VQGVLRLVCVSRCCLWLLQTLPQRLVLLLLLLQAFKPLKGA